MQCSIAMAFSKFPLCFLGSESCPLELQPHHYPIHFIYQAFIPGLQGETMAWSMEYAATTLTVLDLSLSLFVIFLNESGGSLCSPVAATMVGMVLNFNHLHDFLLLHHKRYKTYKIPYPTFNYVLTTDPGNVEHILISNFANYVKVNFCCTDCFRYFDSHIFFFVVVISSRFLHFECFIGKSPS